MTGFQEAKYKCAIATPKLKINRIAANRKKIGKRLEKDWKKIGKRLEKGLFGIININKPKGLTSHDVVAKLRKILKIKHIGHTGTLDPMATGVLPVCIGKAAKIIQYLDSSKAYRARIKLGIKTDTYDMEGEILTQTPVSLDLEKVKVLLKEFEGDIKQVPPVYSAIHHKGKRLYEYARQNIPVETIPARNVLISYIDLKGIEEADSPYPVIIIDVECSHGTYIRSIAHDLGEKLECGATLSGLVRTRAGKFTLEDSYTLEETDKHYSSGRIKEILLNPAEVLPLEAVELDEKMISKVKNGMSFAAQDSLQKFKAEDSVFLKMIYKNELAGIACFEDNIIKPVKVFL